MRWWIAALIVAAVGAVWIWCDLTEYVFRGHLKVASALLGGILLGLWYVFFTGLPWKKRIVLFVAGLAVLGGIVILGMNLFRVEGSVDGGSLPRIVLKDAPRPGDEIGALEVAGAAEVTASSESWPSYLGQRRDGVTGGGWEAGEPELVWKREIGLGWSGFVVEDGLAITQEQRGEEELVSAYSLETGEPVWVHSDPARFSEHFGGDGPRATPTIFAKQVYTIGATGILNCLVLGTGEQEWSIDLADHVKGKNQEWGKSCSPLVYGDSLVVTGFSGGPGLLCFDRRDGELEWSSGDGVGPSYSSPMLMNIAGEEQLIVVNEQTVTGHSPDNGSVLWEFSWPMKFPKVAQPQLVEGDQLLLTASYGADSFLIHVSKEDGHFSAAEKWRSNRMKTKFSSAVVHDGYAYGLDEGRFSCVDLSSGKRLWRDGKYGYGQNLLVGGSILVQAEKGDVVLVEASPERLEEIWRIEALEGVSWNVPCVAGDYLLVRNGAMAACFKKPGND